MKILSLNLENFRGIKSAEFDFGGHDANIYGANGTGKTTVGNAICWLLIDRPMTEEPNFDPKTIGEHNLKIAELQAAEKTKERIAELQDELKRTGEEMETVEHGIHLCEELTRAKARMVEDNINGRFTGIRFQLFKDQINGGLKETCDIMMPSPSGAWVEYKAANTAAQVNGSLEVIDFLNRHYGVRLPVVMDKAGEVTSPIPIDEQFIRLIVSAGDKQLRVEQA